MSQTRIESLKIKAKLLQKAKQKAGKPIQLKAAFATLARAAGFDSWQDLKQTLEQNQPLCPPGHSAHWKVWYASYDEAKTHLREHGGYLLPYLKDFFICNEDYIRFLGIEEGDTDLARVGKNWAEPVDYEAYQRLLKKVCR